MFQENAQPILHIGYPKTATTWFQEEFYPKITEIEFYDRKRSIQTLGVEWQDIHEAKNILKTLTINNKRLVICDESMVGRIDWIEKNAKTFKEIFYPAQIIIFIRNQVDKYISNYSQYIKSGGTARFNDYLFTPSNEIFRGEQHNYDKIISLYKKLFDKSNVHLYLYEEFCEDHDQFIQKFCLNHNLNIKNEQIKKEKINVRLTTELLHLKRLSNFLTKRQPIQADINNPLHIKYLFHIPYWHQFTNIAIEKTNKYFSNKNKPNLEELIGPEKTQFFKDFFASSNNKLITEHGLFNIRKYNYPL